MCFLEFLQQEHKFNKHNTPTNDMKFVSLQYTKLAFTCPFLKVLYLHNVQFQYFPFFLIQLSLTS